MKYPVTANRLNEALNEANMTPQELSRKSGVNKASISQYRNGTHKPGNVSSGKMAEVLGVSPVWLMGFDVEKDGSGKNDHRPLFRRGMYIKLSDNIEEFLKKANEDRVNSLFNYMEYLLSQQEKEDDKQ